MIQRKQTFFLVLALVLFTTLFVVPFASFPLGTGVTCHINISGIQNLEKFSKVNHMFIIMRILATLFMSLVGVAIFMYKKRLLQIRICAFAFLINVFMVGAMFFTASLVPEAVKPEDTPPVSYLFATYLPFATLLLVMAAQRAIRKDEARVRSLNRLRQ